MSYPPLPDSDNDNTDDFPPEDENMDDYDDDNDERGYSAATAAKRKRNQRRAERYLDELKRSEPQPQMPMELAGPSAPPVAAGFDIDPDYMSWFGKSPSSLGPMLGTAAQVVDQQQPIGQPEYPLPLTGESYHSHALPQVQDASIPDDMRQLIPATKRERLMRTKIPRDAEIVKIPRPNYEYWEDPADPDPREAIDDHPRRKNERVKDWKLRVLKARSDLGIQMKDLPPETKADLPPTAGRSIRPTEWRVTTNKLHRKRLNEDQAYSARFYQEKKNRQENNKRIDDNLLQKVREWQQRRGLPREPTPDPGEDSGDGLWHMEFLKTVHDTGKKRCRECALSKYACSLVEFPNIHPCAYCARNEFKCEPYIPRYKVRGAPRLAGEPFELPPTTKGKPRLQDTLKRFDYLKAYDPALGGNPEKYKIDYDAAKLAAAHPYQSHPQPYRSRTPPGASRDGVNPSRARLEALPADQRTTTETPRRRRSRSPLRDRPTDIGRLGRDLSTADRQTTLLSSTPLAGPGTGDEFGGTEDILFGDEDLYDASPPRPARPAQPAQPAPTVPFPELPAMVLESGARLHFGACKNCAEQGLDCDNVRPCGHCRQLNLPCDELLVRVSNISNLPFRPAPKPAAQPITEDSGQGRSFADVTNLALSSLNLWGQVESQRADAVQPTETSEDGAVNLIAAAQQPAVTTNVDSEGDVDMGHFSDELESPSNSQQIVSASPTGFARLTSRISPLSASQDRQNLANETGSQFHYASSEQSIVPSATLQDLAAGGGSPMDFMTELSFLQPINSPLRGGAEVQLTHRSLQRLNGYMLIDFYDHAHDEEKALKAEDFLMTFRKWKPGMMQSVPDSKNIPCVQDLDWNAKLKGWKKASDPRFCFNTPSAKCETTGHNSAFGNADGHICENCYMIQEGVALEITRADEQTHKAYMCTECAVEASQDADILRGECVCRETMALNMVCHPHFESGWEEIQLKTVSANEWLIRNFGKGEEKCVVCAERGSQPSGGVYVCKACHSIVKDWN
ncbi:hypothetical protein HYFRA_00004581 [Hymenoscyphus fraxineus]|uniref:Zn(2)-C6 fungal-type domain-containing protein n=1 Tax=Hymenoscyphus fraxineus TaxID=746836 RepID=A0A9N9KYZ0_9HELO|nr:hypothetical protein HYFRA_00004581 [Hymenoscyphus fraxineus]